LARTFSIKDLGRLDYFLVLRPLILLQAWSSLSPSMLWTFSIVLIWRVLEMSLLRCPPRHNYLRTSVMFSQQMMHFAIRVWLVDFSTWSWHGLTFLLLSIRSVRSSLSLLQFIMRRSSGFFRSSRYCIYWFAYSEESVCGSKCLCWCRLGWVF
jgi:hypothetical protein